MEASTTLEADARTRGDGATSERASDAARLRPDDDMLPCVRVCGWRLARLAFWICFFWFLKLLKSDPFAEARGDCEDGRLDAYVSHAES